ncbi:hypothetical protein PLESTF_001884700 [Pleodorina starrii]|nr:hypothetical protein PLESTF_001884700 [Pleodorina starrii]
MNVRRLDASLDSFTDGNVDGGVSVSCWCLGGGDVYRGADGGGVGGSRRASSTPVAAGSRQPLRGPAGWSTDDFPKAQRDDSESDLDDEEPPALASALRSFRSSVVGWSSRMRLRLLGGSSRLVYIDGVPYPLRTHLKANKPKRSALRCSSTPHSVSCPGRVEDGEYGSLPCSSSSRVGASLAVQAPCKKKLRFAINVLDTGDGDGGGSGTKVDVVGGAHDSASSEPRKERAGEVERDGDGDDGGSGSCCSDDGGGGGSSDAGVCGGVARSTVDVMEIGQPADVRAMAHAPQESPPLTPDASSAATAAAAATVTALSGSGQTANEGDSHGGGDAAGFVAGSGGPFDTASAAETGSLLPGGPQSSSRRMLLRGGPSARGAQVHPHKPPSPPSPPPPPPPLSAPPAERGRQLTSSAVGPAADSVTAPLSPLADTAAAVAALAARPPSLLARLLQGVRDSGSSGASNGSAPPQVRVASFRGSLQLSVDSDSDGAATAAVAVRPQQYPQSTAEPLPKPGRYHSVQLLRNALFEPDPQQPLPPHLGTGGGVVVGLSQRTSRVVSYTSPGIVGGPQNGQALAAPPQPPRRQFLPDPSPSPTSGQQQRRPPEGEEEKEEEEALTEEDERLAVVAAGKLRQRRTRHLEQTAGVQGHIQRGPPAASSAPQRWVTSVRPIGDDVGDDVRDAAAAVAHDSDDAGPFNWLEALRKTRSATERSTFAVTETFRSAGGADVDVDGVEDAADLLRHLTQDHRLTTPVIPPQLLTAAGSAPVVRAGRRGVGQHAVDGLSFSDLSFSVQRAVQVVRGNAAARSKPLLPMSAAAQQQVQQVQQVQQQRSALVDGGDLTSAADSAATAANERSRRIRAAPFAAAMGLLTPTPPPSGPRVGRTVSDRSGAVDWQLQPPQQQQPQPPSQPRQQLQSSQRASVDLGSSSAAAAAAFPAAASSTKQASFTIVAPQAGYALVPESPPAPAEQLLPASAPAVVADAIAEPAAAVAAEACTGRGERRRMEVPEAQVSNLYDSSCGDGGAIGGGAGIFGPLVTSPRAAAFVSMLGADQPPRRLGPGSGGAAAAPFKPLLASPSGLRPSCSSSGRGRNASVADPAATTPPAELAVADRALAPLNTPATDPWAEERCALAGSGTSFATMAASLAQTLAARLDMTSSGVSSGGRGSGGGRGRSLPASQDCSAQFSAALGLQQQQKPLRLRTSVDVCCSPSSHGDVAEVDPPATATATASARFSRGSGGGGGGGYAAARAAAQREAMRVSRGSLRMGIPTETSVPAAAGSGAGGGGGRRGNATVNGFQLPGGIELVDGCSGGGVVVGCRDSAAGGGEGFTAAANGITAGGAVLSQKK